jgi:predicted amidohydrolase
LHCGAYYRDESFSSWHSFAITRAMENQLYLLSLNRAGKYYGNSVFCLPWMDESRPEIHFSSHDEDFRYLQVVRSNIDTAREQYSFLEDRLSDYKKLPY